MGASSFDMTHHFIEEEWMHTMTEEELEQLDCAYPPCFEYQGGPQVILRDPNFNSEEFCAFISKHRCRVISFAPWLGGDWMLDFPEHADDTSVVWAKLRWG